MAKDGTARGGARMGAGRKTKALAEKISEGQAATVMEFTDAAQFQGEDIPPIKDYLKARQKVGSLCAEEVYNETWKWLKERGCAAIVNGGDHDPGRGECAAGCFLYEQVIEKPYGSVWCDGSFC